MSMRRDVFPKDLASQISFLQGESLSNCLSHTLLPSSVTPSQGTLWLHPEQVQSVVLEGILRTLKNYEASSDLIS